MTVFETERLLLRRFQPEDAAALCQEVYSDLEVLRYYNGGRTFTLEEVREFVTRRNNSGQFGYWIVTLKATGELLGQAHLDPYANTGWYHLPEEESLLCRTPEVHLGFAFGRRFWGHGYATEACQALIRHAFSGLGLQRLLGGADINNLPSIALHKRLGFRLIYHADDVVAVLTNPLAAYRARRFEDGDRQAVNALGSAVVDWWHNETPDASLHLVVYHHQSGEVVAHLQARDRGVPEPSRRAGQCHFLLYVAPAHRGRRIGSDLYARLETFARRRKTLLLYCGYTEKPDAPATPFLQKRGFAPLERFFASSLDVTAFDPLAYAALAERVAQRGIVLTTYADAGDTMQHRRQLYDLEEAAHAGQPFRGVEPYIPTPYPKWEAEFIRRDATTVFLAIEAGTGQYVGVVTGLEWYFTGTAPAWRGQGIATALKARCLEEAKKRGIRCMETENHEDNAAMLAINRKLGFVFTDTEVACVKRLS